jgi:hypothetical protein
VGKINARKRPEAPKPGLIHKYESRDISVSGIDLVNHCWVRSKQEKGRLLYEARERKGRFRSGHLVLRKTRALGLVWKTVSKVSLCLFI